MSWKLQRSTGDTYWLLPTSVCKVGRQGCQILIQDTTVSRHHADIEVKDGSVILKDVSKFVQTSVNGNLLTSSNRSVTLQHNDVLTFGACPDKFEVKYDPFNVCVESPEIANKLKSRNCGILFASELVPGTKALIISGKVPSDLQMAVRAMLLGVPLVQELIVSDFENHPSGSSNLPALESHAFPIPKPNVKRHSLFKSKTFVVTHKTPAVINIIKGCGGVVVTNVSEPLSDAFVVSQDLTQPCDFDHTLTDARVVDKEQILESVWRGELNQLDAITPFDISVKIPEVSSFASQSWTTNESPVFPQQEPPAASVQYAKQQSQPTVNTKKFKKARVLQSSNERVTLQSWGGSSKLLPNPAGSNLVFNREKDDLEAWMKSP
jgi:hypothetical protein